ncbi:hypothetical protein FB550_101294 [Neobacillus bataviensis]|uniref:Uncharacterized protein n=1 Tax=Neobacillus bataviensis TaxID=220685 RepID=A0A561DY67_9BACI|nr:hypothetical protein [Neobacillus bataviensis]TWE08276.1 hypothetical protein FB550_101294 [Neobacillus bataviensis]
MKYLLKTQIFALLLTLSWIIYLVVLAFLDQPDRALRYINSFVFGLAILLAIIYLVLTRYLLGRNWSALPLVLISYFLLYKPIFQDILLRITNESYGSIIKFLSISTGTVHLLATIIGMGFGILFSRPQLKN